MVFGAQAHPPTRVSKAKSRGHGDGAALAKAREAEGETSVRDRDVRGSIASTPWEENAHAHDNAVRHRSWGYALHRDPPKRSRSVVKRSIPLVMPFGA